ncbi:MAG: hypothetical protein QQN63_12485 [Nitrosopumilus sp.]
MHKHFYEDILQILDEAFTDIFCHTYKSALEAQGTNISTLNNCAHLVGHVVDNLFGLICDDDMEFDLEEFNTCVRSKVEDDALMDASL